MIWSNDKQLLWIDWVPISKGFTLIMIDVVRHGLTIELCNIFLTWWWNQSKVPTTYTWKCDYCGGEHESAVKPPNWNEFKYCSCKPRLP
jgi:hypothetical protein